MEVKVIWSDMALTQLENIYDYHKMKAGLSVAKKLIKSLVEKTNCS